jgi:hypothetical protein
LPSLRKEGSADRKAMKHSLSNLQGDIYAGILGFFGKSPRVIEKDFIFADLDEYGWKPVKIPIKRRYPWKTRVIIPYVILAENGP